MKRGMLNNVISTVFVLSFAAGLVIALIGFGFGFETVTGIHYAKIGVIVLIISMVMAFLYMTISEIFRGV